MWCADAFYLFDAQKMVFCVLTEEKTRHAQMSEPHTPVAGTVNDQPKAVALIHGIQFKGEIRRLGGQENEDARKAYNRRLPAAGVLPTPVWEIRLDEIKFADNTLDFGKKMHWLCDLQLEEWLKTLGKISDESGVNNGSHEAGGRAFVAYAAQ